MKMAPKSEDPACSKSPRKYCRNPKLADKYDYDLLVIGDGCGGLSAAREAAALGAKVALINQVASPSSETKWGLVGTCVNAGGILKKLLYQAASLGQAVHDSRFYGWEFEENVGHNWKYLRDAIQRHVTSVSGLIRAELEKNKIHKIHGKSSFKDSHTLHVIAHDDGEEQQLTAQYILIDVGSKSIYPDLPGAQEYGIAIDDLFDSDEPPGKTLIIGCEVTGMEYAGALQQLGYEVTVMNRSSRILKHFDNQMATIVLHEMRDRGVKFLDGCEAMSITKAICSKNLIVNWKTQENENFSECFNTLIFAIGRRALTKDLNLENAGIQTSCDGEKIDTVNEQTNISHIYAVGEEKPELTSAARQAGTMLSRRLFGGSKVNLDYEIIGMTLFTPLEYAFAGLSEDSAISRYGEDNIEVYHGYYKPAEFSLPERSIDHCYLKVVGLREGRQKIVGLHFIGSNAGEVIQGFVTALRCGLTIDGLLNTVGVHTTNAEEFTKLTITKSSGEDPHPAACCS